MVASTAPNIHPTQRSLIRTHLPARLANGKSTQPACPDHRRSLRSPCQRRNTLRRVVSRRIHEHRNRVGFHLLSREWREQRVQFRHVTTPIQPPITCGFRQDDGHAIVDRCHQFVRLTRQDRTSSNTLPHRCARTGPDCREPKGPFRAQTDEVRCLGAPILPPLVGPCVDRRRFGRLLTRR